MEKSSIFKRLMIVYFFTFLAAPISYLIRILYARSLSIEAYGLFYSILALLGIIAVFNDFGMKPALVHYLPKFIKNKSFNKIKSAISLVFFVEIISAAILAILIFLSKEYVSTVFFKTNLAVLALPVFILIFFFQNIFDMMTSIFKGYRIELLYSSINPFRIFFVLVASFISSLFIEENLIVTFSVIWVISFLVGIIFFYFPMSQLSSGIFKINNLSNFFRIDKKLSKMFFKYGSFVMISAAAATLLGRIDVLMITYFKGVSDVAFYEVALPLASITLLAISPVIVFLFPNISHYHHLKKYDTIKSMLKSIYNTGFFLFLPLGLILFIFPQEIITVLFGAKYVSAKIALKILAIGSIFKGFALLNFAVASGIGKVRKKSSIVIIGAILNVVLNLLLIPILGIEGAAISTTISFFIMFALSIYYIETKIKFGIPYKNWLKTIINSALFVVIIYYMKTILEMNIYVEVTIILVVSLFIYVMIGFIWKILDYQEIKKLLFKSILFR